jgi:hypothetical protein
MTIVTWIMLAVSFTGFAAGYGLRSYISLRRRGRERRSQLQKIPSSGRRLTLIENAEAA